LKRYANLSFNALEADGWVKPTKEGNERFEQILLELKGIPSIDVGT
jgi:hypothetical protein